MFDDAVRLIRGDSLEILPTLESASVGLIVTDPPYHRVKAEAWDRQWKTDADYLEWMGRLCGEWRRILKPNGSLYVFASPRMAWGVEGEVRKHFEVLNHVIWRKTDANVDRRHVAQIIDKGFERSWMTSSERIIFAEQFGADGNAVCGGTNGFVFASILRYLRGEFEASNLSRREVDKHFVTSNVSQYWLQERGFIIPTAEKWAGLQSLRADHFRREYEDLRREYEDLRRPFSADSSDQYADVWDFPTVIHRPGKHPCEKPLALMEHIVKASSRPGDVVLDCFMGSGVAGEACVNLGRKFIGIELSDKYFPAAERRISASRPDAVFRLATA